MKFKACRSRAPSTFSPSRPKKAAQLIGKTLKTAIADAENNFSLDAGTLVIKEAVIGSAPTQRRFKPRAKGSAGPILRRSSHISITLVGSAPEKKKKVARKAAAAKTEEAPAARGRTSLNPLSPNLIPHRTWARK